MLRSLALSPLKRMAFWGYQRFLTGIVYPSIWVAAAIASLAGFAQLMMGLSPDWHLIALVFATALVPWCGLELSTPTLSIPVLLGALRPTMATCSLPNTISKQAAKSSSCASPLRASSAAIPPPIQLLTRLALAATWRSPTTTPACTAYCLIPRATCLLPVPNSLHPIPGQSHRPNPL